MGLTTQTWLIIAYVLPIILLAIILLRSALAEKAKWLLLACLPAFYIGHYAGLQQLLGWPSEDHLPEKFILLGQQIVEPNKQTDTAGHIHLWIQTEGSDTSRLHRLAYTKDLHQRLASAQQRQAQGRVQQGERITNNQQSNTGEEQSSGDQLQFTNRKTQRPVKTTN